MPRSLLALATYALLTFAACHPRPPAPRACAAIPGADALFAGPPVLLLGEMHGTREFPRFVGDLACALHARGELVVALELPHDEQPLLDRLFTDRGEHALDALFHAPFWTRDYQDGRTSQATAELIRELVALGRSGTRVRIVAIDDPSRPEARDEAMAARIREAMAAMPGARVVALTGNVHNRVTVGVPWDESYRPMGLRLREAGVAVRSLLGTYETGTAWICEGSEVASCGERALVGEPEPEARSVRLEADPSAPYVDGFFHVGAVSASPPVHAGARPEADTQSAPVGDTAP